MNLRDNGDEGKGLVRRGADGGMMYACLCSGSMDRMYGMGIVPAGWGRMQALRSEADTDADADVYEGYETEYIQNSDRECSFPCHNVVI